MRESEGRRDTTSSPHLLDSPLPAKSAPIAAVDVLGDTLPVKVLVVQFVGASG